MAEIETNDFTVPVDGGESYQDAWKRRLAAKIKKAQSGDVLIVRSGLQKVFALAAVSGKQIKVVKRG